MLSRPVRKAELMRELAAQRALLEWEKARKAECWDEVHVRAWVDVSAEAKMNAERVQVARLAESCTTKGSEWAIQDKVEDKDYKGRVVLLGDQVKDEAWEPAIFNDLGSAPVSMASGKFADYYGSLKGHTLGQADAASAYIQSMFGGIPTWVRLPRHRWPKKWGK